MRGMGTGAFALSSSFLFPLGDERGRDRGIGACGGGGGRARGERAARARREARGGAAPGRRVGDDRWFGAACARCAGCGDGRRDSPWIRRYSADCGVARARAARARTRRCGAAPPWTWAQAAGLRELDARAVACWRARRALSLI